MAYFFSSILACRHGKQAKIEEGIKLQNLVSHKSYQRFYFEDQFDSYDINPLVMLIITKPVDYTNVSVIESIHALIEDAQKIEGINNNYVFDWTDEFLDQLDELRQYADLDESIVFSNLTLNESEKSENYAIRRNELDRRRNYTRLLGKFENTQSPYENDMVIRYNEERGRKEIVASRFYIRYNGVKFNSKDAKPMHALYTLCNKSELPVMAYANTFKYYEQFEQTLPNVLQAFIIGTICMFVISLIFVPDIVSAFCIIFSMVSIMVGLIALMNVWGLTLSSITMIEIIMSVGFCIDFSAHVTHCFIASAGCGSRSERAYTACIKTGLPIFNSAISSIIGVCVLAFAESYIFISFFKTMFILMTLGIINSMFFLPVLLSLIGPHWKRHKNKPINGNGAKYKLQLNKNNLKQNLNLLKETNN